MPAQRSILILVLLASLCAGAFAAERTADTPRPSGLTLDEDVRLYCDVLGAVTRTVINARDRGEPADMLRDAMHRHWIVGINKTLLRDALEVIDFAYGTGLDVDGQTIERFVVTEWCEGQLLRR